MELFFDLVYVFAISHVTTLVADEGEIGALRGGLMFTLLWWVWVCYAWLGEAVRADEGVTRFTMFAATAITFLVAEALPEAFVNDRGGLPGPVTFVACYLGARILHAVSYLSAIGRGIASRHLLGTVGPACIASALLLCAVFLPQRLTDDPLWINVGQDVLWLLAIAVEFATGFAVIRGWPVRSVKKWTDRHRLFVIIALGESFLGFGLAGSELLLSWQLVVVSVLGVVLSAALWWAYFDAATLVGEHALRHSSGAARVALARDAYSLLHLPIVAGVVLFSLGLKEMVEYVRHIVEHGWSAPLDGVSLGALYGGVILYLLGGLGFHLRVRHRVGWPRLGAVVLLAALIPLVAQAPGLAAFGLLAAVVVGLNVVEALRFKTQRHVLHEELVAEEQ